MLKRFFYASAGIFLLALSYHLGAGSAESQAPSNSVVAVESVVSPYSNVVTANGDVYRFESGSGGGVPLNAVDRGNIFGAPTNAAETSWGRVKSEYRR